MHRYADIAFSALLVFVFAFALFEARDWSAQNRLYPMVIAIPSLALTLGQLAISLRKQQATPAPREASGAERLAAVSASPEVPPRVALKRMRNILLWIGASFLLLWLLGFRDGIPIFVFAYLRFASREPWWLSILIGAACWVALAFFFGGFLHLPWPQPQLANWFGFSWPGI